MAGKHDFITRVFVRVRLHQAADSLARQLVPLTVLCLAAGGVAQFWLDKKQWVAWAGGLYAAAALLFWLLYRRQALENELAPSIGSRRPIAWWWVAPAIVLGVLAWPRLANNTFTATGTALWAGGLVLLALAVWPRRVRDGTTETGTSASRPAARGIVLDWGHLALLGIMAIGAFYRFYRIDQIPLEMGCDLPHNYNNIRMILRHEFAVFFTSYPGREGLFYYLAAPLCKLFGLSHTTIKIAGSLVGLLTVPVVYLLGKELYNRQVGLIAAFFLSVSHWHIIIGRVGYRAITMPLMLGLMWYALLRAIKTQRPWWYALSGLFLGLGLYTYNAFMIAPVLVVILLLTAFVTGRGRNLLAHWQNVVLLVLVALYVFIPEGRFVYEQPEAYFYRAATRITDLESSLPGDILGALLGTTWRALLMFNYQGDSAFISNVPYLRELGFGGAILFVFGLVYLLWRWRRGQNLTVLASLAVMLLPTILSLAFPQEVPNAIRAIGALPAAVLIPAVGLEAMWRGLAARYAEHKPRELRLALSMGEQVERGAGSEASASTEGITAGLETGAPGAADKRGITLRLRWSGRWVWIALLVCALVVEACAVYPLYFNDYKEHLPDRNYSISLELARAIDAFHGNGEAYIKVWPYWYDGNAVRCQLQDESQSWANELNDLYADQAPMGGAPGKFMVILHPDDTAGLETLLTAFPNGIALEHTDYDGQVAFITFYGER